METALYRVLLAAVLTIGLMGTVLAALPAYAAFVYPSIERAYGGARPVEVQVTLERDVLDGMEPQLAAQLRETHGTSLLLAETDAWIVLRPANAGSLNAGGVVRVRRDKVLVISGHGN